MKDGSKNIANLRMEINRDDLKKIVESGKLTEFVQNASALAAEEIRVQIYEELGKLALNASEAKSALNANIAVNVGLLRLYDDYGVFCVGQVPAFCKKASDYATNYGVDSIYTSVAKGVAVGMTEFERTKATQNAQIREE